MISTDRKNFIVNAKPTGTIPPYFPNGFISSSISDSELPQIVNQNIPVNVNTGVIDITNMVRPGYNPDVILRTNSLSVGNKVIFGWDGQTVTNTPDGFYDLNSAIPAPNPVLPGNGGVAANIGATFVSNGGVGGGAQTYSFSQLVTILKDYGLLQRGDGWRFSRN